MRRDLIPVFLLTLVNVLAIALLIPVLPFMVRNFGGSDLEYGLLITAFSAFQFIGSPLLGHLSDIRGRKPVLLYSQIGTLLGWIVFGLAFFVPQKEIFGTTLPLLILFLGRVIDGITGGNISVTNAYLSDITTKADRSRFFGIMGGIAGISFILGPALGAYLDTTFGQLGPISATIILSILTLVAIYFFLPESLHESKRKIEPHYSLWKSLNIWAKIRMYRGQTILNQMFIVRFLFGFFMSGYMTIIGLYFIDHFHFSQLDIGHFLFGAGIISALNQAILSPKVGNYIGILPSIFLGFAFLSFGIFWFPLVSNFFYFLPAYLCISIGMSLSFTNFKAYFSHAVSEQEQGTILGLEESLNSLAASFAPVLMGIIYLTLGSQSFWILAFITSLPLFALFFYYKDNSLHGRPLD